jgi:hypothetical protein
MTDLLYKLASAIASAEGFYASGDPPPVRNNNPGDLRGAPWLTNPEEIGGFVHFSSPAQGIAGLYHQIALMIARGESLAVLVGHWAPESDGNNESNYLSETARRCGIADVNQPLQELLEIEHIP